MSGSLVKRAFGYISLDGEGSYGSFSSIIMPRDTIFCQEKQTNYPYIEQTVSDMSEPNLIYTSFLL